MAPSRHSTREAVEGPRLRQGPLILQPTNLALSGRSLFPATILVQPHNCWDHVVKTRHEISELLSRGARAAS